LPSLALSDLRTKLLDRVEGNSAFYPNSDLDNKINEALKISNLFCGWSQGRVPIGMTTAGRVFYRVAPGMLFTLKVYLENRELIKDSISTLSATQPKWVNGLGIKSSYWVPIGITRLAIFPADQKGGRYLEAWGVTEPPKLVNPSDVATIPDEQLDLIVEYAFMNLTLKEGGAVFTAASRLYKPWLKKIKGLQQWEATINPTFQVEVKQAA
jgi:hypothetical protein